MTIVRFRAAALPIAAAVLLGGCAGAGPAWLPGPLGETSQERTVREEAESARAAEDERARVRAAVPGSPLDVAPAAGASTQVWSKAVRGKGTRIIVSVRERALWLMHDTVAVFRAPVAVGMNDGFTYEGKRYYFETPVGTRKVLAKSPDPLWVPPDWHYFEKAVARKLEPVQVRAGKKYALADGTHIEVRGDQVGRVNQFGNFAAFTPGNEIIFDRKIFIPPFGTAQRRVPEVLGTHKLEIGDGYLIHGTDQATSIGEAVSHGCVRMYNEDVAALYERVPVGTPVYLY